MMTAAGVALAATAVLLGSLAVHRDSANRERLQQVASEVAAAEAEADASGIVLHEALAVSAQLGTHPTCRQNMDHYAACMDLLATMDRMSTLLVGSAHLAHLAHAALRERDPPRCRI
jgi:hypothetical protein